MDSPQLPRLPGFDGRVALGTGASRGIGRGIAEALAAQGAVVVGTATTDAGAAAITESLAEIEPASRGVTLDVADAESVDAVFADITSNTDAPTIVVNNAGITRDNLVLRLRDEDWEDVIRTNLTGSFNMIRAVSRGMMRRGGRIVNIASVVGLTGNPGQANYAASKGGLVGLTKSVAKELASRDVLVNAVAPGFVETDRTADMSDEARGELADGIPLGRFATPDDVAGVVRFLVSEEADYITGQVIKGEGGMVM
jgi:3-oxoacyl-[acyl-carrier protein] reductase